MRAVIEPSPRHRRIADELLRRIETGALPAGSALPPEVALAREFGVSRQTMRVALEALVRSGRIARRRGKGTVVVEPPIQQSLARFYSLAQEMRRRGAALTTQVLARGRLVPGDELAAEATGHLALADPSEAGYLLRLRLVNGEPLQLETITFPAALCPALLRESPDRDRDRDRDDDAGPDPAAAPFYETLRDAAGLRVTRARETFQPALVGGVEGRLLGVAPGLAVFDVRRASFAGERCVEWRRTLVRGDRYGFVVELENPSDATAPE